MGAKTIVLKAGGVVVGRRSSLLALIEVMRGYRALHHRVVLVVSAPDRVTDLLKVVADHVGNEQVGTCIDAVERRYREWLSELAHQPFGEPEQGILQDVRQRAPSMSRSSENTDYLLASGERMAVKIVTAFLKVGGVTAQPYDASDEGIVTNAVFGSAEPVPEAAREVRTDLESMLFLDNTVAVVTGFIGCTRDGRVTTLGRGGSDYTATFIAEALRADRVEIWKETALKRTDPRLVTSTPLVSMLTYEQAAELAASGMKAIHPRAIGPVRRAKIVTWVRDVFAPEEAGTRIGTSVVSGIAVVRKTCWISFASEDMCDAPGFLARAAEVFSKRHLDIGVTATGDVRISFTVTITEAERVFAEALEELQTFALVIERRESAVVSIVAPMVGPQLISEIMTTLALARIPLRGISMAGSVDGDAVAPQSCQLVIADSDVEVAIRALHAAFFEL